MLTRTFSSLLLREPENAKDPHAVAIVEDTGRIVGHIPLALSRIASYILKRANQKATAEICGKRINRGSGLGLELPVIYKIYGGRKCLDRLDELIHGSETAKRTLREKDEGILIDGQKKRKSTKKDTEIDQKRQRQSIPKSRKNRLDMCPNIPRCCSLSAITREKAIKL
ncbi:unnamed protein product [Porites lobata]|uniref:HIRAN domain-containing protein n=1 Tax=Porites lobata TaxID=104759 RepID=A0ABN8NW21_9CNID|nr:unnamed protein product [Porites lobata]